MLRYLFAATLLLAVAVGYGQQAITLEDIWQRYLFFPRTVPGFNFMNDGSHYSRMEGNKIEEYDLTTGERTRTLFDAATLPQLGGVFDSYEFSEDEARIILATDTEPIYRHSTRAFFYIFDRDSRTLTPVQPDGKHRLATLSPDGQRVAYVMANNLYIKNLLNGEVTQVTTDGEANRIINGATDWVYEEEFGEDRGFYWSPDGRRIAFLRFDESAVPEFTMTNYRDELYPEYVTFKYPKVGERNSEVSVHIYDLERGETRRVTTVNQGGDDPAGWEYVPRIKWTQDPGQLCVFRMNRHQNDLELLLVDAGNGQQQSLLREQSPYYIDIHDNLRFLADGKHFIWTSERSGYNHIYLYRLKGGKPRPLTSGEWEVTDFYGVDEVNGQLFFAAARRDPMQREVYTKSLRGRDAPRPLAAAPGHNTASFSKTFDYFVLTQSSINTPPVYRVMDRMGVEVRTIEDNGRLRELQESYGVQPVRFFDFETSEGVRLNGYHIEPANKVAGQAYPLLMFVYGGPGSQQALDNWRGQNYWWFQMLAQQGFAVACVDNRGTGARGEEFKKMTYLELGKYETIDQIEAAKYLGGLDHIDANRIGIFGWSYGGYMSSNCILKGADVFRAAIAVAPVTNWKWYDTIYTERYMRTLAENADGYRDNSPIYFADQLEGNYLLMHGMGDDNVHFQHTAEMANALIMANKQFETYFYPNRNHGIFGGPTRLHLYTKMTNFLVEKLQNDPMGSTRPTRPEVAPNDRRN
jgi:dipeptidyl-peptidase-4